MSLLMAASKYGRGEVAGGQGGRMMPVAGTTTYGGSGFERLAGGIQTTYGPGMGDPGFFSFLGKAVRGVTGIVSKLGIPIVSGAAGVVGSMFGAGRVGPGFTPMFQPGQQPQMMLQQAPAGAPIAGGLAARQRFFPGGATGVGTGCGQGSRPNKSGYWLKNGQYVAPETVCVKSRRMNPLNPRALSKAMRRIESAKRASSVLSRITIRKKC